MGDLLSYEQPGAYIVSSDKYDNRFTTPVLTAGKTFILGYTSDKTGIYNASKDNPVIVFDDFTTSSIFVKFPFKVKSSAIKFLSPINHNQCIYFLYLALQNISYEVKNHERHWISEFSDFDILVPNDEEQNRVSCLIGSLNKLITLHQRVYNSCHFCNLSGIYCRYYLFIYV